MGAVTSNRENVTYLSIFKGRFAQRFKQPAEGTESRENKNGVVVHEKFYDGWEGHVKHVYVQPPPENYPKVGHSLALVVIDKAGEKAIIQTSLLGGYASDLLNKLCACDLLSPVTFTPYDFTGDDEKRFTGMTIHQMGGKIARPITKDNTPTLPQWKKVEFNGQVVWDKTDSLRFMLTMFAKKCAKVGVRILDLPAQWSYDGVEYKSDVNALRVDTPSQEPPQQAQAAPTQPSAGPVRTPGMNTPPPDGSFDNQQAGYFPEEDDLPF